MVPEHISVRIESELNKKITRSESQSGGDINQAAIISFDDNTQYFIKWNTSVSTSMFETEAKGLRLLFDADTDLVIPEVILTGNDFLLLSLIESGNEHSDSGFQFGVELAKLHKHSSEHFGLDHNNFIGKLPQSNTFHASWSDFFISERIEPQIKLGIKAGLFSSDIISKTDSLYKTSDTIFPKEPPALLHGDLWSGNYMFTKNGKTSIYDPAVYFGHREMDLAMTKLFGGFSAEFYTGYQSEYSLADGFEERVDLCNLYPLLVHANLFGGGYVNQAIRIMNRFS